MYGIRVLGGSGWPLYLPAGRRDSPYYHFCTKVTLGGFPWLNAIGQFLIKDVALLGVSLLVLGESLARLMQSRAQA
ncbi:DUF417 family protein (plasmid) [Skermanella mucosa]|uniref:DUF417 family protein n=1 Tax=Skermanella mucosa TaxID=1789672 RepID=UPI00192AF303|nr:DUF417 family protein [Skermanella mucosa]UEM24443.1 DUF417 family protein [Skermanella mucosa]